MLIPTMRDVLIDQLYLRRVAEQQAAEYRQQARAIVKVREIPVLGKVLQKIYHLFVK